MVTKMQIDGDLPIGLSEEELTMLMALKQEAEGSSGAVQGATLVEEPQVDKAAIMTVAARFAERDHQRI